MFEIDGEPLQSVPHIPQKAAVYKRPCQQSFSVPLPCAKQLTFNLDLIVRALGFGHIVLQAEVFYAVVS